MDILSGTAADCHPSGHCLFCCECRGCSRDRARLLGALEPDAGDWCHDCDQAVRSWAEFTAHGGAGHAITNGRCPGECQFRVK